jgi:hypothetical protein
LNNYFYLFIIFLFFNSFMIASGNKSDLINFTDSLHRFNFSYPYDWKIEYQDTNDIFYFPSNTTKYNNTFIEIKSDLLYNLSLKDHVFRNLNHYIGKYLIGDYISFNIKNIESNLTINELPLYKLEYSVIANDKYQSPVNIVEYYTTDKKDLLYKLKFSEDGYTTNLLNENITKFIVQSFSFDSENNPN